MTKTRKVLAFKLGIVLAYVLIVILVWHSVTNNGTSETMIFVVGGFSGLLAALVIDTIMQPPQ